VPLPADICPLWPMSRSPTVPGMGYYYHFKRGDPVTIISGSYQWCTRIVESAVFQTTVDQPDERAPGYHVVLDSGPVVTVRWDQLCS